jgi:two-component system response regulator
MGAQFGQKANLTTGQPFTLHWVKFRKVDVVEIEPTRILLVEDDPHDVELIQLAFDSYNFINQMDVVEDGEQALHYLFGRDGQPSPYALPRVVLLDLKLPKVKGINVLEAIRSHPCTHNLAVVIMTSSQEDRDLNACYELGANSYIVKPLDFAQFIDVSRQVGLYWMLLNKPSLPS